jgi:hypothetical protein
VATTIQTGFAELPAIDASTATNPLSGATLASVTNGATTRVFIVNAVVTQTGTTPVQVNLVVPYLGGTVNIPVAPAAAGQYQYRCIIQIPASGVVSLNTAAAATATVTGALVVSVASPGTASGWIA